MSLGVETGYGKRRGTFIGGSTPSTIGGYILKQVKKLFNAFGRSKIVLSKDSFLGNPWDCGQISKR